MTVHFFAFEADFVKSLRSVPMVVRFKLDACGITLSLRAWRHFDLNTRARLVAMPVNTADEVARYRDFLRQAIQAVGEPVVPVSLEAPAPWTNLHEVPAPVQRKLEALNMPAPEPQDWGALSPLQRFALVRLTGPGFEDEDFLPAVREFGLAA